MSQTGGAELVDGRAGRRLRLWCVAGLYQQAPESPTTKGAGVKENPTKSRLVELAAGQERYLSLIHI